MRDFTNYIFLELLAICSFYELRKSCSIFMVIYILSLACFNYPLEDFWTKVTNDVFILSLSGIVMAYFVQYFMFIAFVKSKTAES